MASCNKIKPSLKGDLWRIVVLLVLSTNALSKAIQEKEYFVLQEIGTSEKQSVVIVVTRKNNEAVACETRRGENSYPMDNPNVKYLKEKEFNNVIKDCATVPKLRRRRQTLTTQSTKCTGRDCDNKNCTNTSCTDENFTTPSYRNNKNCTGTQCNNVSRPGASYIIRNCTGTNCTDKNVTTPSYINNSKNCTGTDCINENCNGTQCNDKNRRDVVKKNAKNCIGSECDAHDCGGTGCNEDYCIDGDCMGIQDDEAAVEQDAWNIIFPGTKWCGSGGLARSFDDLGLLQATDKCCRAHDSCNDTMAGGETKHNLTNTSSFTKLICRCDDEFYDCLENVNSVVSNTIGRTYFNILRRTCYMEDYPDSRECKTYTTFLKITCREYAKDTSVPKAYMWKQPKRYRKLPIPLMG